MHEIRSYGLRIKNYDISINELQLMINEGEFDLVPSFKGELKWNMREKSKYVESALLNLPLKSILFEEDYVGRFKIVDGADRITALLDYINNKYSLKHIPLLTELEGKYFSDLQYADQLCLKRTTLSCDIISEDSDKLLKCEYLKRINLGDTKFIPQQARNFAFPEAYSFIRREMNKLNDYFDFSIVERSHGSRKYLSQNRAEQFFLCLILIQTLNYYQKCDIDTIYMGSILDRLCHDIENNNCFIDTNLLDNNIKKVMGYLGFNSVSLVYRSYKMYSKYNKEEMSMNDFLCRFFEASNNIRFDYVHFNFFKEDMKLSKLVKFL